MPEKKQKPTKQSLAQRQAQGRVRKVQIEVGDTEFLFVFDKESWSKMRMTLGKLAEDEQPHQEAVNLLLATCPDQSAQLGALLNDPDHWNLALDLVPELAECIQDKEKISLGKPKRLS